MIKSRVLALTALACSSLCAPGFGGEKAKKIVEIMRRAETEQKYLESLKKLDRFLPSVQFKDLPAVDALQRFSEGVDMPLQVHPDVLKEIRTKKITLSLGRVKASSALRRLFNALHLHMDYYVYRGAIHLNWKDDIKGLTVIRTYDVSDLVLPARTTKNNAVPPSRLVMENPSADFPEGEGLFGTISRASIGEQPENDADMLVYLITEFVAQYSWNDKGAIMPVGDVLVVAQSPYTHRNIHRILEQLRKQFKASGMLKNLRLHLRWVLLDRDAVKNPRDRARDPAQYECVARCRSGQEISVASGQAQSAVVSLQPHIDEKSAMYKPVTRIIQWGAAADISVRLERSGDTAVVDVCSTVSEPIGTRAVSKVRKPATFDRLNFNLQTLRATARIPLGRYVMLGGMTGGPAGSGRMLCLFLRIDEEKKTR
jgi:hypothetical protein